MSFKSSFMKKYPAGFLFLAVILILLPRPAMCTEEYAQKTGQNCSVCHIDPSGGGELTSAGKAYQETIHSGQAGSETATGKRVFRLLTGFLHIITGFFWFGTILYVHLVLKPKSAAQGLPKGEMLIGLVSIAIMAITGTILSCFRVTTFDTLFTTRFGILLTVKIALFLVMVFSALFVVLVIAPRLRRKQALQVMEDNENFTLAELSQYDGKEGRPAYFAYEGRVFDATASRLWTNGVHMGRHHAGSDLTDALKLAPHVEDKIMAMPAVGALVMDDVHPGMTMPQKVFLFMAYSNLAAVFGVILILALWRWW